MLLRLSYRLTGGPVSRIFSDYNDLHSPKKEIYRAFVYSWVYSSFDPYLDYVYTSCLLVYILCTQLSLNRNCFMCSMSIVEWSTAYLITSCSLFKAKQSSNPPIVSNFQPPRW